MWPHARFRLADGSEVDLGPGDLIGRSPSAALPLDDPSISEAHAMVSLRGDELKLLALRGRFTLGGGALMEVSLAPGQRLWLTRSLHLDVVAVERPDEVLAIEADGMPPQVLTGVSSLFAQPTPVLVGRFDENAPANLWNHGGTWRLRVAAQPPRGLEAGDGFVVDGIEFRALTVSLRRAEREDTRPAGGVAGPLRIETNWDIVHIHRAGAGAVTLHGHSARVLSELSTVDQPVGWETIAREVWPDCADRGALRRRWDTQLARIRARLREERLRPDLVSADGAGNFELRRYPGDTVESRG